MSGGSTSLTRTQYACSYADYHSQKALTEQAWTVSSWVNDNKLTSGPTAGRLPFRQSSPLLSCWQVDNGTV